MTRVKEQITKLSPVGPKLLLFNQRCARKYGRKISAYRIPEKTAPPLKSANMYIKTIALLKSTPLITRH